MTGSEHVLAHARLVLAEPWQHPVLRMTMQSLADELEHHQRWVADLQSGMYVNCVYCGHRYGPGETAPTSMADALKAHVAQCPLHPMAALAEATTAAYHALRSYEHGNASPELAANTADFLKAALATAGREPRP